MGAITAVQESTLVVSPEVDTNGILTGFVVISANATDDEVPSVDGIWIPVMVRWDNSSNPITDGIIFGIAFQNEFDILRANRANLDNLVNSITASLKTTYSSVIKIVE
jgi:hypothetical protein